MFSILCHGLWTFKTRLFVNFLLVVCVNWHTLHRKDDALLMLIDIHYIVKMLCRSFTRYCARFSMNFLSFCCKLRMLLAYKSMLLTIFHCNLSAICQVHLLNNNRIEDFLNLPSFHLLLLSNNSIIMSEETLNV